MLTPTPAHEKARFWAALGMLNAGALSPFLALLA